MPLSENLLSTVLKKEEFTPIQRFRFESLLTEKFGRDGLRVYFMVNGTNTVRQISAQTGLDERRFLDILRLMDDNKLIKVDPSLFAQAIVPEPVAAPVPEPVKVAPAPVEKPAPIAPAPTPAAPAAKPAEKPALIPVKPEVKPAAVPIAQVAAVPSKPAPAPEAQKPEGVKYEMLYAAPATIAEAVSAKVLVRIPTRKSMGLFGKLKLEAELLRFFGQQGMHLFSLIDGERSDIELSKEGKLQLVTVDKVLDFLAKEGWIEMRALTQEELRERYGEEGVAISDVYGRDGVYVYELIDRKATVRDIILFSGIEPGRGIEIFAFIHKVLGIDIPLDKEALYKQLGVGK